MGMELIDTHEADDFTFVLSLHAGFVGSFPLSSDLAPSHRLTDNCSDSCYPWRMHSLYFLAFDLSNGKDTAEEKKKARSTREGIVEVRSISLVPRAV